MGVEIVIHQDTFVVSSELEIAKRKEKIHPSSYLPGVTSGFSTITFPLTNPSTHNRF